MKRILLFFILMGLGNILSANAQKVTENKAKQKAVSFFNNDSMVKSSGDARSSSDITLAYVYNDGNSDCLFVYNRGGGGFVVISGDERTLGSVLAYSYEGEFDYDGLPENAKYVIDSYSTQISDIEKTGVRNGSVANSDEYPESVEPLLDPIAWDQWAPYNNYCPTIDGIRCPTGCVATAMAQVMYYHKWPEKGMGSNSYYWQQGDKTLSADFSKSTYRWDLMTPTYDGNSNAESCDAVARLMSDCGIALYMSYNVGGSGAGDTRNALIKHFSYDKSIKLLSRDYCSTEYWYNTLKDELVSKRPVIYSGGSSYGGHCFVCDGYQGNYFHFNFGWGGAGNMYCLTSATGFDSHQSIEYGIQKDFGGKPQLIAHQTTDFIYKEGKLCSQLEYSAPGIEGLIYEVAIAVENTKTGEISYYCEKQNCYFLSEELNVDIADGDYVVYIVARLCGDDSWNKVISNEYRQSVIDLNVADGVKIFSNNNLCDEVMEGVTEVNGIFYILKDNTATVTYKNLNKDSYKGHLVIPETITYLDRLYDVTSIGEGAFERSQDLLSVTIPRSVTSFDMGAFSQSSVRSIIVPTDSRLRVLGGWALNGCWNLYKFELPDNLEIINMCAFQGARVQTVILPSSCTDIADLAFNDSYSKVIVVDYNTPPAIAAGVFDWCSNLHTLYVPIGHKEKYSSAIGWEKIKSIVEYSNIVENGVTYACCPDENYATAYLADYDILPSELTLPEYLNYNGTNIPVTRIEGSVFSDNINLRKLTIPSNVNFIEDRAFENCYGLNEIYVRATEPIMVTEYTYPFEGVNTDDCILYVPKGSIDKYRSAPGWYCFSNIKEYDMTSIETVEAECNEDVNSYDLNGRRIKDDTPNRIIIKKGKKYINRSFTR